MHCICEACELEDTIIKLSNFVFMHDVKYYLWILVKCIATWLYVAKNYILSPDMFQSTMKAVSN